MIIDEGEHILAWVGMILLQPFVIIFMRFDTLRSAFTISSYLFLFHRFLPFVLLSPQLNHVLSFMNISGVLNLHILQSTDLGQQNKICLLFREGIYLLQTIFFLNLFPLYSYSACHVFKTL